MIFSRGRPIYIYGVYMVFLAGKSSNIRSYKAYIYGSGQHCACEKHIIAEVVLKGLELGLPEL